MRLRVIILALALSLAAGVATAQQTGQILGKVTDASGAVVPGVAVTLTGGSLLAPQTAITSATGTYQFPTLPIGNYTVKFELTGFKTVVREGIRLEIGFNAQINATMEVSTVQETVTVSGAAPVIDLRDTSKTNRFNQEALQSLPSARDPWVIIEQSAGVAMDRQNVGGSASGQQSNFVARGAAFAQQKWNLDGMDITDMSATGGSPGYFDFDAFEEMQVTSGGSDVTMQTPGVQVNMVTKSGTDKYRGSGRFYDTPDKLQWVNISDAARIQGATSGNPIQDIKDYGAEIGGPIKKGRAWFWGAYGKQVIDVGINNFYSPAGSCAGVKSDWAGVNAATGAAKTAAMTAFVNKYTVQNLWDCLNTDETLLKNYNLKVGVAPFTHNQLNFYVNAAGKIRNARGADDLHPIEATNRQMGVDNPKLGSAWWKTGINKTYVWNDRHIFSDRFLAEFIVGHVGNNFVMDFHDPSLADVQPTYELYQPAGLWGRSYYANTYVRPTDSLDVNTNYFWPAFLGGDHSFKAGFKVRRDIAHSETHYGGNAVARFAYGVPYQAEMRRDSISEYSLRNRSFYLQDSYSRKRLTVNGGIRFDYQTDSSAPETVPQHPFYGQPTYAGSLVYCNSPNGPDPKTWTGCKTSTLTGAAFNQLPTMTFAGAQAMGTTGYAYKNWSPRLGVTYDLTGSGRNVVRFSYAHYVAQAGTGDLSSTYTTVGSASYVRYPWTDLNHDNVVQANEVGMISTPLGAGGNYDWQNPTQIAPTGKNDPNIKMEHTDEIIVSFDKQFGADFAVGASFIYRTNANFRTSWTTDNSFAIGSWTSANYTQSTYTPQATQCTVAGALCQSVVYYIPNANVPSYFVYTNLPDYQRKFHGVELSMRKRMSQRWLLNASFSYNDAPIFYNSPASYQDPSNISNLTGGQYAPQSTSSGIDNVFVNAKWISRLSGSYTLPLWDLNVAGFLNTRGGFPFLQYVQTSDRGYLAGSTSIYLDKVGNTRLPNFATVDFKVDKAVRIGQVRFTPSMDIFNLFNGKTILSERRQQNATNANQISSILAPRVIRFGVRLTF